MTNPEHKKQYKKYTDQKPSVTVEFIEASNKHLVDS